MKINSVLHDLANKSSHDTIVPRAFLELKLKDMNVIVLMLIYWDRNTYLSINTPGPNKNKTNTQRLHLFEKLLKLQKGMKEMGLKKYLCYIRNMFCKLKYKGTCCLPFRIKIFHIPLWWKNHRLESLFYQDGVSQAIICNKKSWHLFLDTR